MTAVCRRASQRPVLIMALVTSSIGGAGCLHKPVTPTTNAAQSASDPCMGLDARLTGAPQAHCTLSQRICFLAGDIPAALRQADFLPEASYTARWQPRVRLWSAQLDELGKQSALAVYAGAVQGKLEILSTSERYRRLVVDSRDLISALQSLVEEATSIVPRPGLGCPFPQ